MRNNGRNKFATGGRIFRAATIFAFAALAVFALSCAGGERATVEISAFKPLSFLSQTQEDQSYVYIGGEPIGISIGADGLIVQGERGVQTESGEKFPAVNSGVKKGDVIYELNGEHTTSLYLFKKALDSSEGDVKLTVKRDGKTFCAQIAPVRDISGQRRVGLALKEDVGGVGTLTFVTQEGRFAALGHYIQDGDTGLRDALTSGNIYPTSVTGVVKGEAGKAGGLQADVNRLLKPLGEITQNSLIGIYGEYAAQPNGELIRVAKKGEAKPGAAQILTTIEGDTPKLYDIDVVKVISQTEADEKGMVILVRDKRLLQNAGGIVQGMSGSPIIQNGALIGAVTHVFVQDPTRGYAVHGRFMLDAAYAESEMDLAA